MFQSNASNSNNNNNNSNFYDFDEIGNVQFRGLEIS